MKHLAFRISDYIFAILFNLYVMMSKKRKVLVVDDSKFSRMFVINKLNSLTNIEIIEAEDGDIALEKIATEVPDCMILDNLMPNKTGIEVLEELNKNGIIIRTILVTADTQSSVKERCMKLGALGFINKPVDGEILVSLVNEALLRNS